MYFMEEFMFYNYYSDNNNFNAIDEYSNEELKHSPTTVYDRYLYDYPKQPKVLPPYPPFYFTPIIPVPYWSFPHYYRPNGYYYNYHHYY